MFLKQRRSPGHVMHPDTNLPLVAGHLWCLDPTDVSPPQAVLQRKKASLELTLSFYGFIKRGTHAENILIVV